MHRVLGNWLHWRIGHRVHFGFDRHSYACSMLAVPRRRLYFSGHVVAYSWWRLFLSFER